MFSTLTTTVLFYILLNLPKIFPLGLRRLHDVHLDIVYAAWIWKEAKLAWSEIIAW